MDLALFGTTLDVIGKILIGISVIFVHRKIVKEKRIDRKVITEMNHEKWFALAGILLIMAGYIIHLNV